MAFRELFQASLNKLLETIQNDALKCLDTPPENGINAFTEDDIMDKIKEYHAKGEIGVYLYLMVILELKILDRELKGKRK